MVRTLAALLLSALLAAPLAAENFELPDFQRGDLGTSLFLGMALPAGTHGFSSRAGRAGSVSLRATRFMSSWVAWGFELGADMFLKHKTLSVPGTAARDASYEAQAMYAGVFARVNLFQGGPWSPYVLGGGGFDRLAVRAAAPQAVCWPIAQACSDAVNAASTGLYLTGGGGVEFHVVRGVTVAMEGRLRRYGVDGRKLAASAESVGGALGVTVWF